MRDFTIHIYEQLLQAIQDAGYTFLTFEQYCELRRHATLFSVTMWTNVLYSLSVRQRRKHSLMPKHHIISA